MSAGVDTCRLPREVSKRCGGVARVSADVHRRSGSAVATAADVPVTSYPWRGSAVPGVVMT
jgi:hypothetical protein